MRNKVNLVCENIPGCRSDKNMLSHVVGLQAEQVSADQSDEENR